MRCTGFVADENVQSAIMLILTENEETPTGQWMKGYLTVTSAAETGAL